MNERVTPHDPELAKSITKEGQRIVRELNHSLEYKISMNERIKQLAEQVGIHFHKGGTLDAGPNGIAKFVLYSDMEKFAELIVKECADVIQKRVSMKYKDGGETEEFMGGHYAGSVLARALIKRHFGVE